MVRPANMPARQSPHVNKAGKIKKAASKKILAGTKNGATTKKKKKPSSAPGKASTKKKRMKKLPPAFIEALSAKPTEKDSDPASGTDLDVYGAKIEVVTSAAIKRVATRVGIACISNEAISAIKEYMTEATRACLLHARSSAHYISSTRTIHSPNLASAMETTKLGSLVCTA